MSETLSPRERYDKATIDLALGKIGIDQWKATAVETNDGGIDFVGAIQALIRSRESVDVTMEEIQPAGVVFDIAEVEKPFE